MAGRSEKRSKLILTFGVWHGMGEAGTHRGTAGTSFLLLSCSVYLLEGRGHFVDPGLMWSKHIRSGEGPEAQG